MAYVSFWCGITARKRWRSCEEALLARQPSRLLIR